MLCRDRSSGTSLRFGALALALAACPQGALPAQTTAPAQTSPAAPYTLHVYEDLLQMPTLVLTRRHEVYPGLGREQFQLRLDGGPAFHPRHTRLEGDDPLQLAVVFDLSEGAPAKLMGSLERTLAAAPDLGLTARDRISVYAVDCHLVRSIEGDPYTPARLQTAVHRAQTAPALHAPGKDSHCGEARPLWDGLATVIARIGQMPGWRAVLVVSGGNDVASSSTWNELAQFAGRFDVTLMGLRPLPGFWDTRDPILASRMLITNTHLTPEEIFPLLCSQTGGLVLPFQQETLAGAIHRTVDLLRSRYIVEFPPPAKATVGLHLVEATLPGDKRAVVLTSGISFPPHDTALEATPGRVATDTTSLPQMGTHRVLSAGPH